MLTRSLSQRVLTLSLPKVNRRKRLEMRYFCVLTRRCGSRPRPEMKNPARRNSRRVTLGPQQRRARGGRAARKKMPPPAWCIDRADVSGDELHNFRLRRCREEGLLRVTAHALASAGNVAPEQANTRSCSRVVRRHAGTARPRQE